MILKNKPSGKVVHSFNHSTKEAETDRSLSVQGQPRLQSYRTARVVMQRNAVPPPKKAHKNNLYIFYIESFQNHNKKTNADLEKDFNKTQRDEGKVNCMCTPNPIKIINSFVNRNLSNYKEIK